MDAAHIRILETCRSTIVHDMDVAPVLDYLIGTNPRVLLQFHGKEIMKLIDYEDRNRKLMDILQQREGCDAFKHFLEALKRSQQHELYDIIINKEKQTLDASTSYELNELELESNPRKYEKIVIVQPTKSQIEKIQKLLKKRYSQRFRKTRPFSLPFTFDIWNMWVSLALREDVKRSHATKDHAKLLKSAFKKEKMLIIEGKPATGKTSLMQRLAYEWATNENRWLQSALEWITGKGLFLYDLLVYAQFRDVREQNFESIADLVIEYNKKYMEKDELEILYSLLHNRRYIKQRRVLILLDGYDESSLKKQCKELTEYLTATTISNELVLNIVLTSRPGYLGQHRGNRARYIFADVLGFTTEKQKEKYIFNHFNSLSTDATKQIAAVHQILQKNDNIHTLAETPLFLTFICLVHERIVDGTVLELYYNSIWWLLDRHQKDFPDRDIPNLFDYQSNSADRFKTIQNSYHQFPQILNLGKMAFNNLEKDGFHESDCMQFNLKEIIQQVGLLRKDEFYDELFRVSSTYSFSHRTIKEFLAALYYFCSHEQFDYELKSDLNTEKMTAFEMFLLRIALSDRIPINEEKRKHYCSVIKFLELNTGCDALQTSNGLNIKLLNSFLLQCINIVSLEIVSWKIEANAQIPFINCQALKNFKLRNCRIERGVAFHIIQLRVLDTLEFKDCDIHLEAWHSITEVIRNSSVKSLDLSFIGNNFNVEYINQLQKCNNIMIRIKINEYSIRSSDLSFSNLKNLHLLTFERCSFEADSELSFKNCPALKGMLFQTCTIERGYTMNIETLTVIEELEFDSCAIDLEAWQSITEEIRKSSVKCLELSFHGKHFNNGYVNQLQICNNVTIGMTIIKYTIRSNDHLSFNNLKKLQSLTLWDCSFEAKSQLSFKNCTASKRKIILWRCQIKRGYTISVETLAAIDTFEFYDCDIDLKAWLLITEEIRKSSIKCLKLSPACSKYLESMQKCDNLEEIYIMNQIAFEPYESHENNIFQQLMKLAPNMQCLKKIIFDFSNGRGELKESHKEIIEKAGQERDPNFTVSIIPFEG